MKSIGDQLDLDFEVKLARNGDRETSAFIDLIERPTIVSVYMRNNTGSCDKQMIRLAQDREGIGSLGYDVIGLSKDTVGSHLRYAEKHSLPFPLVSDPEHAFAKAVDSLVEKKMYGRTFWGPTRSVYVIDRNGLLLAVCEAVDPENHGKQMLSILKELKT